MFKFFKKKEDYVDFGEIVKPKTEIKKQTQEINQDMGYLNVLAEAANRRKEKEKEGEVDKLIRRIDSLFERIDLIEHKIKRIEGRIDLKY